jgi:hypothetical protein
MQLPNRQISDGATSAVKKDVLEVQFERRIRDCKIDAEHVGVCISQAQLPNRNWTQERCIDLVDINNEALLSRSPPNPPTNTMGNGKWRKPKCQQRSKKKKQTSQEKSTF